MPYLEAEGFSLSLDAFFTPRGAEVLYRPRRLASKVTHVVAGTVHRWITLARAPRVADLLFIHREAFPLGRRHVFRALGRFRGPLVYDYDDAMFLPQRHGRGLLARLEDPETAAALMKMSDVVLAGNEFLAAYARQFVRRVVLLPTCIDTRQFAPRRRPRRPGDRPVVGWIGTHTTAKYLHSLRGVLETVARDVPFRLYVVGNQDPPVVRGVEVEQAHWSLAREVEDFSRCDVGIYPLWDDAWAQGKCGFKAIQFMACGVPVVAAAIGVNRQIIQDGVNGYLASTDEAWVERLRRLLVDEGLRERLGRAGRQTVEERYSLEVNAPTLIAALRAARGSRS